MVRLDLIAFRLFRLTLKTKNHLSIYYYYFIACVNLHILPIHTYICKQ